MSIQQLRQLFALESQDTLQQMEDALLHLEENPTDKEAINVLFRTAHTIKGSGGVVGLDDISSFTHVMENVLEKVRSGQLPVTPDFVQFMLSCKDHVERMLEEVTDRPDAPDPELVEIRQGLVAKLQSYLQASAAAGQPRATQPTAQAKSATARQPAPPGAEVSKADRLTQIFVQELQDTLHEIAGALDKLSQDCSDGEAREVLYRSFHTLKGSAGLVGFQLLVNFGQGMEGFMRQCQEQGKFEAPGTRLLEGLRAGHAHLGKLLEHFSKQGGKDDPALAAEGQKILQQLQAVLVETPEIPGLPSAPSPVTVIEKAGVGDDNWHISLRFQEDALRNGVEPLASIRYLNSAGEIASLHTLFDNMPDAHSMDPESCYLGFEIEFRTQADKEEIENMFELVREHCRVHILPPHSQLSHYIDLIQSLPEDTLRLGEILIESGTLTKRELEEGLSLQNLRRLEQTPQGEEQAPQDVHRIGEVLVNAGLVQPEVVEAALRKQRQIQESKSFTQKSIHVDAEKLDQLINLVGELVIANASINLLMQEVSNDRLKEATSMMSRLVEDIRNSTLRMRMVQIGGTFTRFRRLVHDISRDLGKQIDLVISGSETELDKSMVEKINDPLMHLVRNAIDHGVEPEAVRAAKGKPLAGTVQLNAYHDSGSIVIEVSDDGAGLDRPKILAAARDKGMIKPGQELTEQEIDALIFEPALSTAKEVTQLSGRGVGLDVVKRNISALNGIVDVKSVPGEGTTFQIFLPLTLAIIDGFLLTVGDSSFVVPLDRVVECVEFSADCQHAVQTGYLNLRGSVLPLLSLRELFGLPPNTAQDRENIVVVHYGNQEAGLVVDELLGEFQAVIKPLGKIFEKLPGVSGATILGNGEVALILDVPALVKRYARHSTKHKKTMSYKETLPA